MNSVPMNFLHWLVIVSIFVPISGLLLIAIWVIAIGRKRDRNLQASLERMRKHSIQDELTGVFNRRYFEDTLASEWKRAAREHRTVALLLLDVDCFRNLQEKYGQIAGESCLLKVAAALQEQIHRPGDFVARYGGEQFAVVLPGASADGALRIAEAMRTSIHNLEIPNEASAAERFVTLSVGVCSRESRPNTGARELLEAADAALYLAKAQGRNRTQLAGGLGPMVVRRDHGVA